MRAAACCVVSGIVAVALTSGCSRPRPAARAGWSAEKVATIEGFDIPECVLPDSDSAAIYVTNIETATEAWWGDDGKAFISRLAPDGTVKELRWIDSAPDAVLNAPKGMCILGGALYFTDNARLMRRAIAGGPLEQIPVPGAKRLNDLATDGDAVYVSDTEAGAAYRVHPTEGVRAIKAPEGINGVTLRGKRMFAVSWALHEVYELDLTGKKAPEPFGLASHFTNLDGIEVLDDGSFVVSDFKGNKVSVIGPDRKSVSTLVELDSPADIGIDRGRMLLYVPQFMKGKVAVYKLVRK